MVHSYAKWKNEMFSSVAAVDRTFEFRPRNRINLQCTPDGKARNDGVENNHMLLTNNIHTYGRSAD